MHMKAAGFLLVLLATLSAFTIEAQEFKKWLKQYKKEFNTFVDEHDKEFAQFLKTNWVETDVKPEESRDSAPKIVDVPVAEPEPEPEPEPVQTPKPVVTPKPITVPSETKPKDKKPDPVPVVVVPKPPTPPTAKPAVPKPTVPEAKVPAPALPKDDTIRYVGYGKSSITVSMLGHQLIMPKMQMNRLSLSTINSNALADSWLTMAKTDFKPVAAAIAKASDDLRLDDWGQALLTHEYLASGSRMSKNEMQLYSWFLLVKQGFDARVAFNNGQIYLMLNVEQKLFGQKYFNLKEGKYYFVDLGQKRPINVGSVYTYNQQHSSAKQRLTIDLSSAPNHGRLDKTRVLKTKVGSRELAITTQYNSEYIEYLDHYPQLNMEYYFQAELPESTKLGLLTQLSPYLKGKSEQESLNFLLHFVQKSLSYQTDQQQFNYENYLFAGETLHYPYADCEDRAVLFAYLVKNLLGNQVIGLQYDGHIATAVAVTGDYSGDVYRVNGKNYIVADPTFINANIGRTMTGYERQTPEFIVF